MRIAASLDCAHTLPIVDKITLTVRYYGKDDFDSLCSIAEHNIESSMQVYEIDGIERRHLPKYDVTFEKYHDKSYGWGRIYFTPTKASLSRLQAWLEQWLYGEFTAMCKRVKLSRIELAYDFCIPNMGYLFHAGIAKRLLFRLWQIGGRHIYATYYENGIEHTWQDSECPDFDKAIANDGKCRDGAINGDFTGYIQSCQRSKQEYSSHSLDPNSRASYHTTIYPKELNKQWRVRVELELAKSGIKRHVKLNYMNFASLLDCLKELPFSRFYEFREADFQTFIRKLKSMPEAQKVLSNYLWQRRIGEVKYMPVVDQIRLMKAFAKEVGKKSGQKTKNKRFKDKIVDNFTRQLDFTGAIASRLAPESQPSQRTKKGERPAGEPFRESLGMLLKIGKKVRELEPVCQGGLPATMPAIPFISPDIHHNRAELALTGEFAQNTIILCGRIFFQKRWEQAHKFSIQKQFNFKNN